jgi:hypothetical protein
MGDVVVETAPVVLDAAVVCEPELAESVSEAVEAVPDEEALVTVAVERVLAPDLLDADAEELALESDAEAEAEAEADADADSDSDADADADAEAGTEEGLPPVKANC